MQTVSLNLEPLSL
uniref:Uncharacterized protein n=1 Tax=Anguilla anguilla TaxID=7936 RepID=A0A0E9PVZ8_ANGAN